MTKQEQKNLAWKKYLAIRALAWEEYLVIQTQAIKEYKAIQAPAWEEYEAIQEPAWKEYLAKCKKIDEQYDVIKIIDGKEYRLVD